MVGVLEVPTGHRSSMTPAIESALIGGLVGIIVGVVVSVVGTIVGARVNRTNEHQRWLREERLIVYTDLLAISSRIFYENEPTEALDEMIKELMPIHHRGRLLTNTAYGEIAKIRQELFGVAIATLEQNTTERNKTATSVVDLMTSIERKARQELGTRPISQSEIPPLREIPAPPSVSSEEPSR